ncbi:1-acyl-sn-glycerol-3-phosphate acyltransferase [Brevundimonas sp. S30B]|uniref:lysophospholipid acyltransferase family protein n=1 Tax=unclassified Brevundimonas TaxID=2622653 RepID=UPI0010718B91|nr:MULTISPECIES: lysophospholipid acyltransferase family protein [unclassified Brevundimonas]QBX38763.1 1-acyl-sn-glycerol-3-phosphate acyltransferase [Brevundimonas sp. MF30-B]TFW01355.1 1-acyl-sn-glycerol-3-phosphate acyltransferase [Brevundimonas sp. S30B]
MTTLRSLIFTLWLYLSMALYAVILSPALLMPHRQAMGVVRMWAKAVLWGLRIFAGVRVEVRGLEHLPTGPALVASKHQGMLDVVALLAILPDPCFVLKKELMPLPFFGWFAWKTKMIAVDRSGHAKALKDMARQARDRLSEGRQIIIFPEGTRTTPGQPGHYKPGVAAIYRDLDGPCWPVATNSGVSWPAHGFRRYPGLVAFEFLDPIPAGMKRAPFMALLESRIETASNALLEPKTRPAHLG